MSGLQRLEAQALAPRAPRVAIVGGGLLGLAVAFRLLEAGVAVTLFERDKELGGLAGSTMLGGRRVDRYYHVVLPTDDRVHGLAAEVGIGESFRFRRTRVGFYHEGQLTSMSSLGELLTFPALAPLDRVRLGAFVARCQLKGDFGELDQISLEDWLRRLCGDRAWERLWRPLFDSKFDGRFDDLPATYLWARTRRMSNTRDRSSREVMGTIHGGYQTLVDALADAIQARGGELLTGTAVQKIASNRGRAIGVVTDGRFRAFDQVVLTPLLPAAAPLLPSDLRASVGRDHCRYLGVVCLVMLLRRSVSPYYTLNITDRRIPLTTVVETTHVVDPDTVGGRLVYAPKYVSPDSPELERPSSEIKRAYMEHVRTIFPGFGPEAVVASQVARARVAEPVHTLGGACRLPGMFPAPGLALASTAHIYPELVNGQAVIGVAERLAEGLGRRLAEPGGVSEAA